MRLLRQLLESVEGSLIRLNDPDGLEPGEGWPTTGQLGGTPGGVPAGLSVAGCLWKAAHHRQVPAKVRVREGHVNHLGPVRQQVCRLGAIRNRTAIEHQFGQLAVLRGGRPVDAGC